MRKLPPTWQASGSRGEGAVPVSCCTSADDMPSFRPPSPSVLRALRSMAGSAGAVFGGLVGREGAIDGDGDSGTTTGGTEVGVGVEPAAAPSDAGGGDGTSGTDGEGVAGVVAPGGGGTNVML